MSSTRRIIHKLAKESQGKIKIIKIPPEKCPTPKAMARLDREISAQISANRDMEYRSYINASKKF